MLLLFGVSSKELFMAAAVVLAPGVLFTAWRCFAHLKMTLPQAALVSVSSNLGAGALTAAGFFMLGAMFLHGVQADLLAHKGGDDAVAEQVQSEQDQKEEAAYGDKAAAEILADPKQSAEARAWLAGAANIMKNTAAGDAISTRIEDFYAAGAKQVTAVFDDPDRPGALTQLIVHLPEAPDARQKVFAVHGKILAQANAAADPENADEEASSEMPKDIGQKYLMVDF
jgi:hypothetical protein